MITGAPESVYARGYRKPRDSVELLNPCNRLGSAATREERPHGYWPPGRRDSGSSHFETAGPAEVMTTRLSSPFAAQILGQILPREKGEARLRGQAYARAEGGAPGPRLLGLL